MITTYVRVPFPAPILPPGAHPCSDCLGQGVTGGHYTMPMSGDRQLLLDVWCPGCQGCGAATHDACKSGIHALDDEGQGDERDGGCPSCGGRGWCTVSGWSASDPDAETVLMRVPCGCQEHRAEIATPEEVTH